MEIEFPLFFFHLVAVFWVYDDAKKRRMDAGIYAFLTLVLPFFGFIYFWIRRDEFPYNGRVPVKPMKPKVCPNCRWANEEINHFCSRCGYKFDNGPSGSKNNSGTDAGFDENVSKANLKECKTCGSFFAGTLDSCPRCGSTS